MKHDETWVVRLSAIFCFKKSLRQTLMEMACFQWTLGALVDSAVFGPLGIYGYPWVAPPIIPPKEIRLF